MVRTHAACVSIRTLLVIIVKNRMCQYCSLLPLLSVSSHQQCGLVIRPVRCLDCQLSVNAQIYLIERKNDIGEHTQVNDSCLCAFETIERKNRGRDSNRHFFPSSTDLIGVDRDVRVRVLLWVIERARERERRREKKRLHQPVYERMHFEEQEKNGEIKKGNRNYYWIRQMKYNTQTDIFMYIYINMRAELSWYVCIGWTVWLGIWTANIFMAIETRLVSFHQTGLLRCEKAVHIEATLARILWRRYWPKWSGSSRRCGDRWISARIQRLRWRWKQQLRMLLLLF